jgi:serine/threonine protein kinase
MRALMELAQTLAWLHGEGMVHRDLKPDNVILDTNDAPILVDFGVAEQAGQPRERLTIPQVGSGTLKYMAPEQREGVIVDARADLHALGCLIEEVLLPRLGPESEACTTVKALCVQLQARDPAQRPGYASDVSEVLARLGAAQVEGRRLPTPRPYLYRPALIGRAALLARISAIVEGASSGMLLLTGPPGAGRGADAGGHQQRPAP